MPKKPAAKTRAPKQKKMVLRQANLVLLYNVPFRDLAGLRSQAKKFGITEAAEDVRGAPAFGDVVRLNDPEGGVDRAQLGGLIAFKSEKLAEAWFAREFGEVDPKKCYLVQGEGEEFGSPDLAGAFVPV